MIAHMLSNPKSLAGTSGLRAAGVGVALARFEGVGAPSRDSDRGGPAEGVAERFRGILGGSRSVGVFVREDIDTFPTGVAYLDIGVVDRDAYGFVGLAAR